MHQSTYTEFELWAIIAEWREVTRLYQTGFPEVDIQRTRIPAVQASLMQAPGLFATSNRNTGLLLSATYKADRRNPNRETEST
jgi:hypothetical protein